LIGLVSDSFSFSGGNFFVSFLGSKSFRYQAQVGTNSKLPSRNFTFSLGTAKINFLA
jgi:hypothetical protein